MSRGQLRLKEQKKGKAEATASYHCCTQSICAFTWMDWHPPYVIVTFTSTWPGSGQSLWLCQSSLRKKISVGQKQKQNLMGMVSLQWWDEEAFQLKVCGDCSSVTWDGWLCGCQDKIQPPFKAKHTLSPVLRSSSSTRPLAVGTLEFHFLLLFQSLSHPSFAVVCSSVVILFTDLSAACPCLMSLCGLVIVQSDSDVFS